MILTITLHCSGRDAYSCEDQITADCTPDGHWATRIRALAQHAGWTGQAIRGRNDPSPDSPAFCSVCTDALLDLATGVTRTNKELDILRDILLLVGLSFTPEEIATWTPEQRQQAERWAAAEHLYASDNPVKRLPRPSFLGGEHRA